MRFPFLPRLSQKFPGLLKKSPGNNKLSKSQDQFESQNLHHNAHSQNKQGKLSLSQKNKILVHMEGIFSLASSIHQFHKVQMIF